MSRSLLTQGSRHLPPRLIFDVRHTAADFIDSCPAGEAPRAECRRYNRTPADDAFFPDSPSHYGSKLPRCDGLSSGSKLLLRNSVFDPHAEALEGSRRSRSPVLAPQLLAKHQYPTKTPALEASRSQAKIRHQKTPSPPRV